METTAPGHGVDHDYGENDGLRSFMRDPSEDLRVDLSKDGDRYLVSINGAELTEVYKARMETDRYRNMGGAGWNRGRTRWMAGNIADEDYGTRKEAVAEVVRRYRIRLEKGQ